MSVNKPDGCGFKYDENMSCEIKDYPVFDRDHENEFTGEDNLQSFGVKDLPIPYVGEPRSHTQLAAIPNGELKEGVLERNGIRNPNAIDLKKFMAPRADLDGKSPIESLDMGYVGIARSEYPMFKGKIDFVKGNYRFAMFKEYTEPAEPAEKTAQTGQIEQTEQLDKKKILVVENVQDSNVHFAAQMTSLGIPLSAEEMVGLLEVPNLQLSKSDFARKVNLLAESIDANNEEEVEKLGVYIFSNADPFLENILKILRDSSIKINGMSNERRVEITKWFADQHDIVHAGFFENNQGAISAVIGVVLVFMFMFGPKLGDKIIEKIKDIKRRKSKDGDMRAEIEAEIKADKDFHVKGATEGAREAWGLIDNPDCKILCVEGTTGNGKDYSIREMINLLVRKDPSTPKDFWDAKIKKITPTKFQERTMYRGNVADKVSEVFRDARKHKMVLVLEEGDQVFAAGGSREGASEVVSNLILSEVTDTKIRENLIILMSTSRGEVMRLSADNLIRRIIFWYKNEDAPSIAIENISDGPEQKKIEKHYKVKLSREVIEAAGRLGEKHYRPTTIKPVKDTGKKTLPLARYETYKHVLWEASRSARAEGRTEVTVEDVIRATEKRANKILDRAQVAMDLAAPADSFAMKFDVAEDGETLVDDRPPREREIGEIKKELKTNKATRGIVAEFDDARLERCAIELYDRWTKLPPSEQMRYSSGFAYVGILPFEFVKMEIQSGAFDNVQTPPAESEKSAEGEKPAEAEKTAAASAPKEGNHRARRRARRAADRAAKNEATKGGGKPPEAPPPAAAASGGATTAPVAVVAPEAEAGKPAVPEVEGARPEVAPDGEAQPLTPEEAAKHKALLSKMVSKAENRRAVLDHGKGIASVIAATGSITFAENEGWISPLDAQIAHAGLTGVFLLMDPYFVGSMGVMYAPFILGEMISAAVFDDTVQVLGIEQSKNVERARIATTTVGSFAGLEAAVAASSVVSKGLKNGFTPIAIRNEHLIWYRAGATLQNAILNSPAVIKEAARETFQQAQIAFRLYGDKIVIGIVAAKGAVIEGGKFLISKAPVYGSAAAAGAAAGLTVFFISREAGADSDIPYAVFEETQRFEETADQSIDPEIQRCE